MGLHFDIDISSTMMAAKPTKSKLQLARISLAMMLPGSRGETRTTRAIEVI
jgi:hypothetical protein